MIPNYQECMLPLLQLLSDNQIHTSKECVEKLSVTLELTEEEKSELLPSGKQTIISNSYPNPSIILKIQFFIL